MAPYKQFQCSRIKEFSRIYSVLIYLMTFTSARVYFCPRWSSRSSNWKCLLGAILLGAWNSAWWSDAERQNHRRRRWFLQHFLQWNWSGKTCSSRCVCWFGTHSCWYACSVSSKVSYVFWKYFQNFSLRLIQWYFEIEIHFKRSSAFHCHRVFAVDSCCYGRFVAKPKQQQ